MIIRVTKDEVLCDDIPQIHRGEFNVHELVFEFSEEYNNLSKTAIFENGDIKIAVAIINNKCSIPNEILMSDYTYFKLRVYGYDVVEDKLEIRYSPMYLEIPVVEGSYTVGTQDSEMVSPTQFEQYVKALELGLKELENTILDFKQKEISGYFNGTDGTDGFSPIATVTKSGDTATISITDKNGTTTASVSDGTNGTNGTDGTDGFSPIATVTKSGNTATISITDVNGTTTASVSDGTNGTNGTNGTDGFSPIATVTKSGNTATILITDVNGTTTASVSDGLSYYNDTEALIGYSTINNVTTPVYRKLIIDDTNSSAYAFDHGISNIGIILNVYGIVDDGTNSIPLGFTNVTGGTTFFASALATSSQIVYRSHANYANTTKRVFVEYTKTS